MSMLAEPKRRQRISVNPNGVAWSSDASKFGQKLLEKMGWQEGKGLGLNEHGDTSHIKVKLNMDSRGLGCTKKEADNWIAHQDDFNSLLAQLNQDNGSSEVTPKPNDEEGAKSLSLLEKSKSSRKRVHYEKFTKGKDLSRYGDKSLDQIFGRRTAASGKSSVRSTSSTGLGNCSPQANSGDSGSTGAEANGNDKAVRHTVPPDDVSEGSNMVASSMNVMDYFASKLAARKRGLAKAEVEAGGGGQAVNADEAEATTRGSARGVDAVAPCEDIGRVALDSDAQDGVGQESSRKKKKHARSEKEESSEVPESIGVDMVKKKKSRRHETYDIRNAAPSGVIDGTAADEHLSNCTTKESSGTCIVEAPDPAVPRTSKKRNKRPRETASSEMSLPDETAGNNSNSTDADLTALPRHKKAKVHRLEAEDLGAATAAESSVVSAANGLNIASRTETKGRSSAVVAAGTLNTATGKETKVKRGLVNAAKGLNTVAGTETKAVSKPLRTEPNLRAAVGGGKPAHSRPVKTSSFTPKTARSRKSRVVSQLKAPVTIPDASAAFPGSNIGVVKGYAGYHVTAADVTMTLAYAKWKATY